MSFQKVHLLLFILLFLFSFYSYSNYPPGFFCEKSFRENIKGSRLDYMLRVLENRSESARLHPQHIDIKVDKGLVTEWSEVPDVFRLQNFPLPRDVHYIKHQLYQPGDPSSVKLKDAGENALIARAYYTYSHGDGKRYRLGTNVVFSARALMDNMESPYGDHWLVGKNARAAILFLHGGGTKTTGAHAGASMVNHFRKYKIDVLSLDLPWHAQGHREFFDFGSEINVLSAFAKKYIPPNVPLFVWGHSWGGVFAERLMMMTDRPSFLFHKNLKGVIMMSTAVDSAPGGTVKEKYQALNERLREAKETAKDLGAESERDIFDNIIYQGKFGPLANMVSSSTILQLDQRPPSHEGRLYIPALMLVGTHDSLVYIAWRDLYHQRYENLKNVKSIFVDKATLEVDREKIMAELGHLLADFKYPALLQGESEPFYGSGKNRSEKEGRSILQYGEALAFIEEQLKLQDVRDLTSKSVRDSVPIQKNWDVTNLERRIKYLPSFDIARELVDESRVRELVPLDRINKIKERIDQVESSDPIITADDLSNKQNTNFIHVVQKAANDLAFRSFLENYHYFDSQVSRNDINRFSIEIAEDVKKMLHPFTAALKRVLHLLQGLATKEDLLYNFDSVVEELNVVISIAHQPNSPISPKLLQDLIVLKEELKEKSNVSYVIGLTKEILENNENIFRNIDMSKLPRKQTGLLDFVVSPKSSLEAVARKLEKERVPKSVIEEVLKKKGELMIYFEISSGKYIPTEKELEPFFRSEEGSKISENGKDQDHPADSKKRRVMIVLDKLGEVVSEKSYISGELVDLRRQLKNLRGARGQEGEYKKLSEEVARNIKIIQEGLLKGRTHPPLSLLKEDAGNKAELRKMIEVLDKLEENLNMLAADMKNLSTGDIVRHFDENQRANVDNFTKMYVQYVTNRQSLDKKIITAMEQGEMGKKYQDAVLSIYGSGSRGEPPTRGESSGEENTGKGSTLYLDLVEFTRDLAGLEAELRSLEVQKVKLDVEYNRLMHQLLNLLVDGHKQTESDSVAGEAVLNRIRYVIDIFSSADVPMLRLLNGEHISDITDILNNGNNKVDNGSSFIKTRRRYSRKQKRRRSRSLNDDKAVITSYVNDYENLFREVLKDWKRLTATLPAPLPTVADSVSSGKEVEVTDHQ